jgi:hypothetical protein
MPSKKWAQEEGECPKWPDSLSNDGFQFTEMPSVLYTAHLRLINVVCDLTSLVGCTLDSRVMLSYVLIFLS